MDLKSSKYKYVKNVFYNRAKFWGKEKEPNGYNVVLFQTVSLRINVFRIVKSTAYVYTKVAFI